MDGYTTRSLRELTRVLFSRLVGIILVLVVVVAAVVAATMLSRWQYRSRALLLARPLTPMAAVEGRASLRDTLSLFVVTQRELIKSDYVVASALMKMGGVKEDGALGPDKKTTWYAKATVASFAADNAKDLAACKKRIKVETPGGPDVTFTQTFTVSVDWPEEREVALARGKADPRAFAAERAQQFGEHLLSAYMARRAAVEERHAQRSRQYLLGNATKVAADNLEEARKELADFISTEMKGDPLLVQSMLTGIGEVGSASLSTSFKSEMTSSQARLKELEALAANITAEFQKGADAKVAVPGQLLRSNPSLTQMLTGIAVLRLEFNNLRQQFTDDYEKVKQLKGELAANISDLKEELGGMIKQERAALQARLKEYQDAVAKEQKTVNELAAKSPDYKRLKSNFDSAQEIYNQSQAEAVAAQSAEALATSLVEVTEVDAPSRPDATDPHRPIIWLNILVGIVAGLILSLIYAFVADHFDHSVKGMDDVHRHVEGINVLASVPRFRRSIVRAG